MTDKTDWRLFQGTGELQQGENINLSPSPLLLGEILANQRMFQSMLMVSMNAGKIC